MIAPAILVATFDEFVKNVEKINSIFSYAQIDVMDGKFVPAKSFPEIEKINAVPANLKWEVHLMAQEPLAEMKKWAGVKNVFRVLFHIESTSDPLECIAFAKKNDWQVGLVLNPETPLTTAMPYLNKLDVVMFMTVVPGKQGNPFVPEVGEKIKEFVALKNRPLCAVDGAVSITTIPLLKNWGVEIFNVGSALMKASDIKLAYAELQTMLN